MVSFFEGEEVGSFVPFAGDTLKKQAESLWHMAEDLDDSFDEVIRCLLSISGRIAVTGMGKSGHVARKVAATLASTGSPAYFIHPAEASHGDLGMVSRHDAVIAFSNSGETAELSDIILFASRHGVPITGVTKRGDSFLARHADHVLLLPNEPEACPIGCAPTTSTTLQMALGDAIALSLLKARGFGAEDFHRFHPGGRLGRKLMTVREIMHVGEALPLASLDSPMTEILCIMTGKGFGCVGIMEKGILVGIITDGDLRRHMDGGLLGLTAERVMSRNPITVDEHCLAAKALGIMQSSKITSVYVVRSGEPVGILNVHDCLRAGVN